MLPLSILYLTLMYIGFMMIRSGNFLLGLMNYLLTTVFDFAFIAYYYDAFIGNIGSSVSGMFYWLFLVGMIFWVMIKTFGILVLRTRYTSR